MDSQDLEAAVAAGVIAPDLARRLRNFSAQQHAAPLADEERFGAIGGMADVMTSVGLLLAFVPLALVLTVFGPLEGFALAAAAWGLAEYFTRRRRMTLTSFLLFAIFAVASAMAFLLPAMLMPGGGGTAALKPGTMPSIAPLAGLVVAAGTTGACLLHWWRFRLPVAITVAAVAAINALVHVARLAAPSAPASAVAVVLLMTGLTLFAAAMWWDMSDIRRETRRADVAFWLHCAAGYQIASASFKLILGVTGSPAGWDRLYTFATRPPDAIGAMAVLALFLVFAMVALAIDRRSLLLSSLAYAVPATASLLGPAGPLAAAALAGVLLLVLAGYWTQLRRAILPMLSPAVRAQLPRADLTFARARPVA